MLCLTGLICYSYLRTSPLASPVLSPTNNDHLALQPQTEGTQDLLPHLRHAGLASSVVRAASDQTSGSAEVDDLPVNGLALLELYVRDELPDVEVPPVPPLPAPVPAPDPRDVPALPDEAPGQQAPNGAPPALALRPEAVPVLPPGHSSSPLPASEEVPVQVLWEEFPAVCQPDQAHQDPHRGAAILLQVLPEVILHIIKPPETPQKYSQQGEAFSGENRHKKFLTFSYEFPFSARSARIPSLKKPTWSDTCRNTTKSLSPSPSQ